jgi:Flp pilus assembly protein TadG
MGKGKVFGKLIKRTEGAVAVITAMGIIAFIGMVSLAIDMGHLYTVRNELQNVADASALAAAGSLIQDGGGGVAVRNAAMAQAAALQVAQRQSQLSGQTAVGNASRNDLTIIYGTWNINAGNPSTAWTVIGSTCGSNSNANAVQVTIARAAGTVYGPVSNFFGGIMGLNISQVQATAIAYLGYTSEVLPGTVQVPLALPSTGTSSPLASNGRSGWFARLFGPDEAVASATKTVVFKDTGGTNVNNTVDNNPTLDSNQGYFYTVNSTDTVPDTIKNTLAKIYTPSLQATTNVPVLVGDLKLGQAINARS